MKRIAIIKEHYVRDAQVLSVSSEFASENLAWDDNFINVKYPCLYLGIYESENEDEIRKKAADYMGVHPDIISLEKPGRTAKCVGCLRQPMKPKTEDLDDQDMILCPACGEGLLAADAGDYFGYPKFCSDCGQKLNWTEDNNIEIFSKFDLLRHHAGHKIEVVTYGGNQNVSIECLDCCEVLYSVDNPKIGKEDTEIVGTTVINKVFYRGSNIPLMPKQLAAEAGFNFLESDYPYRISGKMCDCENGGEFDLFPKDHPAVIESGGKRYMRCWICGEISHL